MKTLQDNDGGFIAPDIATIADLADKAGSEIVTIPLDIDVDGLPAGIPALLDRNSGKMQSVKHLFEEFRTHPERKTGTANIETLDSFIELTERFKTGASAIFAKADWKAPSLTTVVDYHPAYGEARVMAADNCRHRIHYRFPLSEPWKDWVAINSKPMSQVEFAEFIEDHLPDLSSPDTAEEEDFRQMFGTKVAYPNELVALSRGLQVHAETRVKNSVTLQTGEGEITWDEEHKDAAGNKISVPGLFILNIPPFFMGDPARIPVRLRYRVREGKVVWICQLYRPEVQITEQVMRDLERAARETGLPHFIGTPEISA